MGAAVAAIVWWYPKNHKRVWCAAGGGAQVTGRAEDTWRYLHWPFELCVGARGQHECVWQVFDADRAGCLRCSFIHRCSTDTCNLVQTEEAMVCDVTGLCLVTKNFVQQQYSECVGYQGSSTTSEISRIELAEVRKVVHHILSSRQNTQCRVRLIQKFNTMLYHSMHHYSIHHMSETTNAIDLIEAGLGSVCHRFDLPLIIPPAQTTLVVDTCTQEISTLMSICYYKLRLHIRPSDIRDIVVGLLFLMRTGINVHGVCVLPHIPQLVNLLPIENMLPKIFHLESKIITDVENRFKMHIRQLSRAALVAAGFFEGVQMQRRATTLRSRLAFLVQQPLDGDAT